MCSGPVSGDSTSAEPSRMPTRLRRPLPSADTSGARARARDDLLSVRARAVSVRRRAPAADRNRSRARRPPPPSAPGASPSAACSSPRRSTPPAGRTARRTPAARRARASHGPRFHVDLADRHAERGEKLEVLILHVLRRVRRNAVRREQPVHVARARAVEPELDRRARERRDDAGLEVDLQVDDQIELARRQLAAHVEERRARPWRGRRSTMSSTDGWPRTSVAGPGCSTHVMCASGECRLSALMHGEDVYRVADRAHHHDADAVEAGRRRRSSSRKTLERVDLADDHRRRDARPATCR